MRHRAALIDRPWSKQEIRKFRQRLLAWYRRNRRMLPWRSHPTPYRVWIAEIMLQQTRVQAVLPYYEHFLQRFPNIPSLAAASEADVLECWAGLGYYQRARNLLRSAKIILDQYGGRFPGPIESTRRLPGIGRYTAGAIHSIAFNQPEPAVDGNVRRIIGRLHGIGAAPGSFFWEQAEILLARNRPADFNQALMELGAIQCAPSRPLCSTCPVRPLCRSGQAGLMPAASGNRVRAQKMVEMVMLVLECQGRVVLDRQPEASFVPGDCGLPWEPLSKAARPAAIARRMAYGILGSMPPLHPCGVARHGITHRNIFARIYRAILPAPLPDLAGKGRYFWSHRAERDRHLVSSLFHKALEAAK